MQIGAMLATCIALARRLGTTSCTDSLRGTLLAGLRGLATPTATDHDVWATEIKLQRPGKVLEVHFSTGEVYRYPAELLRVESPAAEAPRDRHGRPKIIHGRRHVGIMAVEAVGAYAVRLQFDDMHGTGIYTWPFLHQLGSNMRERAKDYIRLLKRHGLSRDPPKPKASVLAERRPQQQPAPACRGEKEPLSN